MRSLLDWQNLLFLIPLGVGAFLAVGGALGFIDDGQAESDDALSIGRPPLGLRLLVLSLGFGGAGLIMRGLLDGAGVSPLTSTLVAAGAGAGVAWVTGRAMGRLFARHVRLFESHAQSRRALVGRTGLVVVAASERAGAAQVRDERGDLHQVSCLVGADEAPIPAGAEVLLVDYDEERGAFLAARSPLMEP